MLQGMSPAEIIDLAIIQTGSRQYWDLGNSQHLTDLYKYLNIAYKKVYNGIVALDKNYFRESWTIDSVVGQSEYPLEVVTHKHFGQYKVEKVYSRYKFDGNYILSIGAIASPLVVGDVYALNGATYSIQTINGVLVTVLYTSGSRALPASGTLQKTSGTGPALLPYTSYTTPGLEEFGTWCRLTDRDVNMFDDPDDYTANQPESDPFALISDKSLFVYPAPKKPIPAGIKFQGTKYIYKLDSTMTESDIIVPVMYHELIATAMEPLIYKHQQLLDKAGAATNSYKDESSYALGDLETRQTTPVYGTGQPLNRNFE